MPGCVILGLVGADKKMPPAADEKLVGSYPAEVRSGGGERYDRVLEYRVWTKIGPELYLLSCSTYSAAVVAALKALARSPKYIHVMVLVAQDTWYNEKKELRREPRIAEWDPAWLVA